VRAGCFEIQSNADLSRFRQSERDMPPSSVYSKEENMLHLIWYIIVGLIAGVVAKSAMHMHMSLLWTIVLGIVGSIVGGLITHLIFRPREGASFHPAGIIVSILGAILVLFLWHHFKLHIPTG
jgi:uncharacterized membrane protein YeaQ/YmgE (transglycosylase-associated protein family)